MSELSEKQLFEKMLRRAQVTYVEAPSERQFARLEDRQIEITVPTPYTGGQISGYRGFMTQFHFDQAGWLLEVSIWE